MTGVEPDAFDAFTDEEREGLAAGIDEARGKVRGLSIEEIDEITGDDVRYWLGNDFMSPDLLAEKVRSWISAVVAAHLAPVEAERTRHYAAFCGSEAEVARLTAERDSRHNAWAAAVKQAHAAEARAAKAEALVEAGLGLAEWHETKADKARRFRPEINGENLVMDKAAQVHDDAANRLRAALGGAK